MIVDLIHENKNLDEYELSTVLDKLADVINVSVITPPLGEVIIKITSDILESDSNLLPFTNRCVCVCVCVCVCWCVCVCVDTECSFNIFAWFLLNNKSNKNQTNIGNDFIYMVNSEYIVCKYILN